MESSCADTQYCHGTATYEPYDLSVDYARLTYLFGSLEKPFCSRQASIMNLPGGM